MTIFISKGIDRMDIQRLSDSANLFGVLISILFICEKIPNEIVEKIVNFLNVEVEILFMSNEHNMNYNYLLSLMDNKSNSNHIPISLKFLNKIIKNLLTFREIINDNFKINNLINKN